MHWELGEPGRDERERELAGQAGRGRLTRGGQFRVPELSPAIFVDRHAGYMGPCGGGTLERLGGTPTAERQPANQRGCFKLPS